MPKLHSCYMVSWSLCWYCLPIHHTVVVLKASVSQLNQQLLPLLSSWKLPRRVYLGHLFAITQKLIKESHWVNRKFPFYISVMDALFVIILVLSAKSWVDWHLKWSIILHLGSVGCFIVCVDWFHLDSLSIDVDRSPKYSIWLFLFWVTVPQPFTFMGQHERFSKNKWG